LSSAQRTSAKRILEAVKEAIPRITGLSRPEHRFAALIAVINRVVEESFGGRVIVVGGFALELLLGGTTRTLDVDIIVTGYEAYKAVEEALQQLSRVYEESARGPVISLAGVEKAIDLLGPVYRSSFDPIRVEVPGFGWFYLEAPEQLLIRYLREWVYWDSEEARRRVLLIIGALGDEIDISAVEKTLQEEDKRLLEALREIVKILKRRGVMA